MILIVGLGNPHKKYQKTRHNIGFGVVEKFFKKNRNIFSDFKFSKKFKALICQGMFDDKKIILAKPQTSMNLSGKSVKLLINYYFKDLWVIHDDLDIPLGKIRIVQNQGSAGHKGVESIIEELGRKDFVRFRIGIKPKQDWTLFPRTEKFVLDKFSKKEEGIIKEVIEKSIKAIEFSLKEGIKEAMSRFNV